VDCQVRGKIFYIADADLSSQHTPQPNVTAQMIYPYNFFP